MGAGVGTHPREAVIRERDELAVIYEALLEAYGPQGWWPQRDGPVEICIGAILVQHSTWAAAARAIEALRDEGLIDLDVIARCDLERLASLVRPCGTPLVRARRLQAFARAVSGHRGGLDGLLTGPFEAVRARLLGIHGVGPETADAIALYARGLPTFVIDASTRRLCGRLGLGPRGADAREPGYEAWREWWLARTPHDAGVRGEWHALIVAHGKQHCRARAPSCDGCPLLERCAEGRSRLAAAEGAP